MQHVARRVEDGAVHGRGSHQRRRDELVVRHQPATNRHIAHQGTDSDAHRQQVEQRLEESADDDQPLAAIGDEMALDHALRATHHQAGGNDAQQDRTGAQRQRLGAHGHNLTASRRVDTTQPTTTHTAA